MLHKGVSRRNHHYRQRHHPAEGACRRPLLRSHFKIVSNVQSPRSIGGIMHFELKSISAQSIPEALSKVERYRLLNEPSLAESICLDILTIIPDHQQALISLLLARTDQFGTNANAKAAQEVLSRIRGDYERAYYAGIILERMGHAHIHHGALGGE